VNRSFETALGCTRNLGATQRNCTKTRIQQWKMKGSAFDVEGKDENTQVVVQIEENNSQPKI
jgi:hypothetical protein